MWQARCLFNETVNTFKIMNQTFRWILVSVVACAICSLVTYRIAYHRAYKDGEFSAMDRDHLFQSIGFFTALQSLRAGDIPLATRQMEKFCFDSAERAFKYPQPPPYDDMVRILARGLVQYRATYRTNSADWDTMERKLEVELAKEKSLNVSVASGMLDAAGFDGLKTVNVSEAQVRAFLNDATPNPDPPKFKFNSPAMALFTCMVLPPTNLFSPEGLRALRDEVAGGGGFEALKQNEQRAQAIFNAPLTRYAVADGWISWDDLGIQPSDSAAFLRTSQWMYSPDKWEDYFLTRCEAWSWVKQERFEAKRIQLDGLTQLRLLSDVNCLDLVEREKLIHQIASVQVLSATPTSDQPPIHDWRDVRGLFFTPCFPALQDTYYSLAALEILGGLNKIDREACIEGILKQQHGMGLFTSPDSGGYNEYHIDGSARDTIAAFESLRILGALDRVKDLDKWQFRVASYQLAKPDANGIRTLTWNEIEAWVCQQRLEKILRVRKEHPAAPVRSLLEP